MPKSKGKQGDGLTFGERLSAARRAAGFGQADLKVAVLGGKKVGSTISNWEKGKGGPTHAELAEIARLLGVSAHWLVLGEGPRVPDGEPDAERKLQAIRHILDEADEVSPPTSGATREELEGEAPDPEKKDEQDTG